MTGRQCKLLRTRYNLSFRQLARACGVTHGAVRDWEQGRLPITPARVLRLALVFYTQAKRHQQAWADLVANATATTEITPWYPVLRSLRTGVWGASADTQGDHDDDPR